LPCTFSSKDVLEIESFRVVQREGRKQEYLVSYGNKLYASPFVCQPFTLPPLNEF